MKKLQSCERYALVQLTREDKEFYCVLGWFFGSRQVARELGMPIYDDDNRTWVVVMHKDEPVACSSIEIKGSRAVLKSAWVKLEHRRGGLYTRMLMERMKIATAVGVKVVTATATEAGGRTLLKHGFESVGTRGRYCLMRKGVCQ